MLLLGKGFGWEEDISSEIFFPEQVANYNKITLKNLYIFPLGWVTHDNLTILESLNPTSRQVLGATIPLQKVFTNLIYFFFRVHYLAFVLRIMRFLALSIFLWACFWSPTSNTFKRNDNFLIWWVRYISFFFLLYKTYYLKSLTKLFGINIVKMGNCHNLFLGYSPKSSYFLPK
jgi:hypothetical protein